MVNVEGISISAWRTYYFIVSHAKNIFSYMVSNIKWK
jgi:hypothetical protein